MAGSVIIDELTGRKFTLDEPDQLGANEEVTFLLNLHGGGSVGPWQHEYFPAYDYMDELRLVIATPSAATKEPSRRWVAEADDEHLRNVVDWVFARYGAGRIRAFWLVGHSQGGMTSNRLLEQDYFKDRVDGWLSLSGGRIGAIELPDSFFDRPGAPIRRPPADGDGPRPGKASMPDVEMSYIFSTGSREMVALPDSSPWAEKYGAGPRVRLDDIVDEEAGKIWDTTRAGKSTPAWGLEARPGTAEVYVYPDARDGRLIADVVRLEKGHTEGYEPRITRKLLEMIVAAPGGKARALLAG